VERGVEEVGGVVAGGYVAPSFRTGAG
jgi:hypothetical protein